MHRQHPSLKTARTQHFIPLTHALRLRQDHHDLRHRHLGTLVARRAANTVAPNTAACVADPIVFTVASQNIIALTPNMTDIAHIKSTARTAPPSRATFAQTRHTAKSSLGQQHLDAVKELLDLWANWLGTWEALGKGVPRNSPGAPDARIQSFEDLEIESEKIVVRAVHTCVYELPKVERDVILLYYGFAHTAWKPGDDALFDQALASLYHALGTRVAVC